MQQIVEIPLNGVSTTPSDYSSPEGDLAFTSGVSNTKGSWQPLPSASKIQSMPEGYRLLYVHHGTSGYINGICLKESDNKLYWASMNGENKFVKTEGEITWHALGVTFDVSKNHIVSLGNVITILTDEPIKHYVWKTNDYVKYVTPNDINLTFGLRGHLAFSVDSPSVGRVMYGYFDESFEYDTKLKEFTETKTVVYPNYTAEYDISDVDIEDGVFYAIDITMERNEDLQNSMNVLAEICGYKQYNAWYSNYKLTTRLTALLPTKDIDTANKKIKLYFEAQSDDPKSLTITNVRLLKGLETGVYAVQNDDHTIVKENISTLLDAQTSKNRFVYPFLIRYAYELTDGSITYASAPTLMIPNDKILLHAKFEENNKATIKTFFATTEVVIKTPEIPSTFTDSDTIKNVLICISNPIYTDNLDKSDFGFKKLNENNIPFGHFALMQDGVYDDVIGTNIYKHNLIETADEYITRYSTSIEYGDYFVDIYVDKKEIKSRFDAASSAFKIVKKIPVEDLKEGYSILELEDNALSNLPNYPTLDTTNIAISNIYTTKGYVYNGRLNLFNIIQDYFAGWNPSLMMNMSKTENSSTRYAASIKTTIEGKVCSFVIPLGDINASDLCWFYTPLESTSVTIYKEYQVYRMKYLDKAELDMSHHISLSGKYYFNPSFKDDLIWERVDNMYAGSVTTWEDYIEDKIVTGTSTMSEAKNKLILSNVNNPLVNNLANTIYVGNGEILAMTSANRPISEGQFGQYPVYCFTTHGVWALEVNADGTYGAPKPITRDVVTNINSITQIDDAVVFVTKRGLMLLSGGQSQCLTDNIDDTMVIKVPTQRLTGSDINVTINPKQILEGCNIIYDYPNQRLICYNSNKDVTGAKIHPYAMVFSLKNQQWSYIVNDMDYSINSYPDALVITDDAWMRDMTSTEVATSTDVIIYTRPFRLCDTDYKTINELRINGVFKYDKIKCMLQASNDLLDWVTIATSTSNIITNKSGTPTRFFRLCLSGSLSAYESISSMTVKFTPKDDAQIIGH